MAADHSPPLCFTSLLLKQDLVREQLTLINQKTKLVEAFR